MPPFCNINQENCWEMTRWIQRKLIKLDWWLSHHQVFNCQTFYLSLVKKRLLLFFFHYICQSHWPHLSLFSHLCWRVCNHFPIWQRKTYHCTGRMKLWDFLLEYFSHTKLYNFKHFLLVCALVVTFQKASIHHHCWSSSQPTCVSLYKLYVY